MEKLKEHSLGILLSVLVGLVYLTPHLVIPYMQRSHMKDYNYTYRPIHGDWNNYEGTPANQFLKGRWVVKGYAWEHRNDPTVFPPVLTTLAAGILARISGSSTNGFVFGRFFWNFSVAFLIYLLLYLLTGKTFLSAAGMVFSSVAAVASQKAGILYAFIAKRSIDIADLWRSLSALLPNHNMDYVAIHVIFFMTAVIFLYMALKTEKMIYFILCGIAGGGLFYVVLYHWTTFLGALLLALVYFIIRREVKKAAGLSVSLAVMATLAVPWLVQYRLWRNGPAFADFSKSHSVFYGRDMDPLSIMYLFLLAAVYFIVRKKNSASYLTIAFIMVSAVLLRNMQIVTNFTVYPCGWWVKVLDFFISILLIYALSELVDSKKMPRLNKYYRIIVGLAAALILFVSFWRQVTLSADEYTYSRQVFSKGYYEAYDWLNRNTDKDSVVLTLFGEANADMLAVTHNLIYNGYFNYNMYTMSEGERLNKFYAALKLFGVPAGRLRQMLDISDDAFRKQAECDSRKAKMDMVTYEATELPVTLFTWRYKWYKPFYSYNFEKNKHVFNSTILERIKSGDNVTYIPEDIKDDMVRTYADYASDIKTLLGKYRVDYLLAGPFERKVGDPSFPGNSRFFSKVYANEYVQIYKVNSSK